MTIRMPKMAPTFFHRNYINVAFKWHIACYCISNTSRIIAKNILIFFSSKWKKWKKKRFFFFVFAGFPSNWCAILNSGIQTTWNLPKKSFLEKWLVISTNYTTVRVNYIPTPILKSLDSANPKFMRLCKHLIKPEVKNQLCHGKRIR